MLAWLHSRTHRKGLGVKRKGLKLKKAVGPLNMPLHSRYKKGKKPKREWFTG